MKKIGLGILVIILGIFLFLYFGTFSEGTRAGIIMKISKKGVVFKTWEGQMNLQTFGAVKDPNNIISETFTFSIDGGDQELIDNLNAAALSGERINLHYIERYVGIPWRGDTKVFAVEVEMQKGDSPPKKENPDNFPLRD